MAATNIENANNKVKENKNSQQNAEDSEENIFEYSYLFSRIDNIYRPYKTYFSTNISHYILIAIALFSLGFAFSAWLTYNYPHLSSLSGQAIKEIQRYLNKHENIPNINGMSLCSIPPIEATLSSLQGLFSLDQAKTMETCVAMATVLGNNDSINILLALIAVQSTLAIAIAFTKAGDKKEAAGKIADLSLLIFLFSSIFSGATVLSTFNSYRIWGVILNIALLLASYCLTDIGNLTNSNYIEELSEWEKKLKNYREVYRQIIEQISYKDQQSNPKKYVFNIRLLSSFIESIAQKVATMKEYLPKVTNSLNYYIIICEAIYCFLVFNPIGMFVSFTSFIPLIFFTLLFSFFLSQPAAENDVLHVLGKKLGKERNFLFTHLIIFTSLFFNAIFIATLWLISQSCLIYYIVILIFHALWLISLFRKHNHNSLVDKIFISSRCALLNKDIDNMDKELEHLSKNRACEK